MTEHATSISQQVANDLEGVIDGSPLRSEDKARLRAIVIGAIPGNRDLPLFLLAKAIAAHLVAHPEQKRKGILFDLLSSANAPLRERMGRLYLALLNFLASMDGYRYFETTSSALDALASSPHEDSSIKACTSVFAGALYRYRSEHLPADRHRGQFNDIRRFLGDLRPEGATPTDGDALEFWYAEADRTRWTLYETVLGAMISYSQALELELFARSTVSLDNPNEAQGSMEAQTFSYGSLDEILNEAIDAVETSTLKIFKQKELAELHRFARLGRHAMSWERSSWALFAFGPFQASLVQLERQGDPGGKRIAMAACEGGPSYADIGDRMAANKEIAMECLALAASISQGTPDDGNAAGGSIYQSNPSAKATAMMRRNSFSSHEPQVLHEELERLQPALTTLSEALTRLVRRWKARLQGSSDGGFHDDKTRFAEKLAALYLHNGKSANGTT